ncbi:ABC-type metal ion transport system, periplasmic component/surface adhesin [Rubidibacter lacunae KORDI 51-2]|uniref:ABC-type metal ion transport system, periplasmic component/surface adhesin n=1 Tax=Rubidibacter lacunae KORDI 51-2 TaxID=582515 RepID=U5DQR6_9CHRO|nr:zinc ABC transporter substrate-binding protein [Rubidibacter lacunae]ERN42964.1 ABC-type metal ion transport system, periplasmic component/surface adhesin [Rubidibacter lacunae KORDI 51-2]
MFELGFANHHLRRFSIAAVSVLAFGLGSCGSSPTVSDEPTASDAAASEAESATKAEMDTLQVVTTFLPVTQFTKAVVGDRAEVVQLLPANIGPHDYQAKPTDVQAIAKADVLVKNGLEIEFFLEDPIDNAGNEALVVIDTSEGVSALASADEHDEHGHDKHEEHGHDEHEHDEHGHDEHGHDEHDASPEGKQQEHVEEGHHHHGEFDPHIWLDPKRAIEQVENIRDGLIAVDPDGEAEFVSNAAAYIEQLQALDAEISAQLAPYAGQTFITFHDFAFYFAESYDLSAEFLVDFPAASPSPEDVRQLIERTKAENIQALLAEPQAGNDVFASLAKDLDVKISVFDPVETGGPDATEPEYYFIIMRQNADNLEEAFGGSVQSQWFLKKPYAVAGLLRPFELAS